MTAKTFYIGIAIVIVLLVAVAGWLIFGRTATSSVPTTMKNTDDLITADISESAVSGEIPLSSGEGIITTPYSLTPDGAGDSLDVSSTDSPDDFKEIPITIADIPMTVEVADTRAKQEKGLVGRDAPPRGHGMLYVLSNPSRYSYSAEGMIFDVDLIWINDSRLVVDMKAEISSQSVPDTFEPNVPINYILEVPAGFIQRNGIQLGDEVDISALP
ncbi:MAG: DUF192 domain-containing protein [bacterium]|nr:DUF192 domain-containing protein [bacterium]